MPPPALRTVRKPTVTKPASQDHLLRGYGQATSTDTWNKTTSDIQLVSSSTSKPANVNRNNNSTSSKPAVGRPHPPINSGSSSKSKPRPEPQPPTKKPIKTLPGSKLKPLSVNDDRYSSAANAWDPKHRLPPTNSDTDTAVGRTSPMKTSRTRLNNAPEFKSSPPVSALNTESPLTVTSRSPSVSSVSNKPILPEIKSSTPTQGKTTPDHRSTPTAATRAHSATVRDVSTAKLRREAAQETKEVDKISDYYIPDWYKNPLIRPEPIKAGISIFSLGSISHMIKTMHTEEVTYYPISSLPPTTDLGQHMEKSLQMSLLTLVYLPDVDSSVWPLTLSMDEYDQLSSASLSLAELYVKSHHTPDTYHLSIQGHTEQSKADDDDDKVELFNKWFITAQHVRAVADSLKIDVVTSSLSLDLSLNEALKQRNNLEKQEKITHQNVYLQNMERDDVWNHINLCHSLTESSFSRGDLQTVIRSVIDKQLTSTSSVVLVSGLAHCGKTHLLAQLPSLYSQEALVLVRFCGLTRLTGTLSNTLIGLCKQLHVMFGSPLLPKKVCQSPMEELAELFKDVLRIVSAQSEKPVILVLDGFDKLSAPALELYQFIKCCRDSVPADVCLIISMTESTQDSDSLNEQQQTVLNHFIMDSLLKEDPSRYKNVNAGLMSNIEDVTEQVGTEIAALEMAQSEEEKTQVKDNLSAANINFEKFQQLSQADETLKEQWVKKIDAGFNVLSEEMRELSHKITDNKLKILNELLLYKLGGQDEEKVEKWAESRKSMSEFLQTRSNLLSKAEQLIEKEKSVCEDVLHHSASLYSLCSTDYNGGDTPSIKVPELSGTEASDYIRFLVRDKMVSGTELNSLCRLTEFLSSPLYLHLCVNRSLMNFEVDLLIERFVELKQLQQSVGTDITYSHEEDNYEDFLAKQIAVLGAEAGKLLANKYIVNLYFSALDGTDIKNLLLSDNDGITILNHSLPFKTTVAERMFFYSMWTSQLDQLPFWVHYVDALFSGCCLDTYDQTSFIHDAEMVQSKIGKSICSPSLSYENYTESVLTHHSMTTSKLATHISKILHNSLYMLVYAGHFKDEEEFRLYTVEKYIEARDAILSTAMEKIPIDGSNTVYPVSEWLKELILTESTLKSDAVDEWVDGSAPEFQTFISGTNQDDSGESSDKSDMNSGEISATATQPVTADAKFPQGRWRMAMLEVFELYLNLPSPENDLPPADYVVEKLLSYGLLVPLLHNYGVDFVLHTYESLLSAVKHASQMSRCSVDNLLALELLCNLMGSYTAELRADSNNLYTLFLSTFNKDTCITSKATLRLYNRIMLEVNTQNNPHLITMLVRVDNSLALSTNTKRYLQRTAEKYAACQCISNASYILSHNNSGQVKLWQLTGEFISAQSLDGRIITVCAIRKFQCFMALVETVSEVGQKFASVWYIDRLTNKKVADLGSKTVLSAWFCQDGKTMVLVEQHAIDKIRVTVSVPQTMEIKVDDQQLVVCSYQESTFMDKHRLLPVKIHSELRDLMVTHLSPNKKDSHLTELSHFKPAADGNYILEDLSENPLAFASLKALWDDILEKMDVKEDLVYPMSELSSPDLECRENISKMKVMLHGMTSAGNIVVDCMHSDKTHSVFFYKLSEGKITLTQEIKMNESATMTLMPTDDFIFSDTGEHAGLNSWHLPSNSKKIFGNEQHGHVTCLQFEVEEGQILSFTRGHVTAWNAIQKTTESNYILDKSADVMAACLQDNWLAISNNTGELTIRFDIRKKMGTYQFKHPLDWIDCHVIGDYLYVACHVLGDRPSICFLKYRVSDTKL